MTHENCKGVHILEEHFIFETFEEQNYRCNIQFIICFGYQSVLIIVGSVVGEKSQPVRFVVNDRGLFTVG